VFLYHLNELEAEITHYLQHINRIHNVQAHYIKLCNKIVLLYEEHIMNRAPHPLDLSLEAKQDAWAMITGQELTVPLFIAAKYEVQHFVFEQTYPKYVQHRLKRRKNWTDTV
jgi:hypothetical protein